MNIIGAYYGHLVLALQLAQLHRLGTHFARALLQESSGNRRDQPRWITILRVCVRGLM
jgi:hypothetical protein